MRFDGLLPRITQYQPTEHTRQDLPQTTKSYLDSNGIVHNHELRAAMVERNSSRPIITRWEADLHVLISQELDSLYPVW